MNNAFQTAKQQGYSDDEILDFLGTHDKYSDKIKTARDQGYSNQEISDFFSSNNSSEQENEPQERSLLDKAGRVGSQFALGMAENALLPYELSVAPLTSKDAQQVPYRENLGEDLERLLEQKASGIWDDQDQELYDSIVDQLQNPQKSEQFLKTADIGVRGLVEKATGLDLHPEGVLEKAAGWTGFIKNPKNIKKILDLGLKPKEILKAIMPTGSEALRGLGAGAALEAAEEGEFGPIGTMAALVAGDLVGAGAAGVAKGAGKLLTQPKKALAEVAATFTSQDKMKMQKDLIKDFRDAGLQADLGTLTNNNLVKWTQSRLAQSGLTGEALKEFKNELTDQIKREYGQIADELGKVSYQSTHEAGEIAKEGLKRIREADLAETRQLYSAANKALKENAFVDSKRLAKSIESLEKELKPGRIKSTEQQAVLNSIEKLKEDLFDSSGNLMYANVKDLMNNKIALNDIINYEVQGGAKQLLKSIVGELDRAIISHGKDNPSFAKNYINANKRFSQHAKTFRNRNVDQLLKSPDPSQLMNKMNTVQGIRDIQSVLSKSAQGKEIFDNLKRTKLEKVIGDKLVDSTTQQVKLGTFSKLLEPGKNKEVMKEILGAQGFKRLERLQKNAGKLAEAAQEFYNASKSGVVAADAAILYQGMKSIADLLMLNPWPIMKVAGGLLGGKKLSGLLGDKEFLKLVEDVIVSSEKRSPADLVESVLKLKPYILQAQQESNSEEE